VFGSDSETGTFDDCGFTIAYDFTTTSRTFEAREVKGSDGQAYLAHDVVSFRNVLTNPATGEWMLLRGSQQYKEMTGRHIEGTIWEFTAQYVGQPFVIENSQGEVVLRDRGRTTSRFLFDTLGDGQPGGELLGEVTTGVFGPHPSLDADFCAIATQLIG
jgi:hypothetical protein